MRSVTVDGVPLPPRHDLANHSPEGFEYGYAGSCPSQLALGILAHHFHATGDNPGLADDQRKSLWDAKALALHHDFKLKLITPLQGDWQFDTHVVADTVSMVVKEKAERYFALAMRLEMENRRLTQELSECYTMLEQAQSNEE